jgi:hypothetical protein
MSEICLVFPLVPTNMFLRYFALLTCFEDIFAPGFDLIFIIVANLIAEISSYLMLLSIWNFSVVYGIQDIFAGALG